MGDTNVRDNEGMCPLHCAAQYCKPRHVHVLYEGIWLNNDKTMKHCLSCITCIAECDFTIVDIEGKTALHWTVDNPDSSCIEALVYCFPSLLNVKWVALVSLTYIIMIIVAQLFCKPKICVTAIFCCCAETLMGRLFYTSQLKLEQLTS